MIKKILIPIAGDDVAPRFDLATEVLIIIVSKNNAIEEALSNGIKFQILFKLLKKVAKIYYRPPMKYMLN